MKNISNYSAAKYTQDKKYSFIEEGIYRYDNPPDVTYNASQRVLNRKESDGFKYKYGLMLTDELEPKLYVTSLTFEQEPELGESDKPSIISQYPLEDLLDKYRVHVSDFYEELNGSSQGRCYQEFASPRLENIKKLREIIGKHVYDNNGQLVVE